MSWATLCDRSDLTPGQGLYVEIDGFKLAVFLDPDTNTVHAIDDTCPHAKGSLGHGWVDRGCAVCPLHAWAFDLRTGSMRGSPGVKLRTYPLREKTLPEGRTLLQADLPTY